VSLSFPLVKRPATGSRGMVVTNHPLASAAGAEVLLAGGNAVDAAVAALFALSVVEPMMVGPLGGGIMHIRLPDGTHTIIDAMSTAPAAAHEGMFEPVGEDTPSARETRGRRNALGPAAVAVPGALAGWAMALDEHGTWPLARVIRAGVRLSEDGFTVTPYLADCIADLSGDLATDAGLSARFLPGGRRLVAGDTLVQPALAETFRRIAAEGPGTLHGGALGREVAAALSARGGLVKLEDLAAYRPVRRVPVIGRYRGHEIVGPPPPASSGVHIAQMLAILEGFDIGRLGFGTADTAHLLAEALKIAFADRAVGTADPAFVTPPVARLVSAEYAAERRAAIDMRRAGVWRAGLAPDRESADTTHLTVADASGLVVSATQTINGLFGACVEVPGTGLIANNYMLNYDPRPGRALSIRPGKRCFTSMAPMMVTRGGHLLAALGLPGGLRIFPSAMQAIVNLIDHRMTPQEAVEAPRLWTDGGPLELEPAFPETLAAELAARGHAIHRVPRVAGGMNLIAFGDDGLLTGAACWRADGTPVGIAGGLARAGVRFSVS
jgi:gamma-glutamyltranspeptidase/glutathione hydrolase